jgi:hypothetical protein
MGLAHTGMEERKGPALATCTASVSKIMAMLMFATVAQQLVFGHSQRRFWFLTLIY